MEYNLGLEYFVQSHVSGRELRGKKHKKTYFS